MSIVKYVPEVQNAIDAARLSIHTARAFSAMTEAGQRRVWADHSDYLLSQQPSAKTFHQFVRNEYPPMSHPEMYLNAESVAKKLESGTGARKRRGRKRAPIGAHARSSLVRDVDARKAELDDKLSRIRELQDEVERCIPAIEALRGHPDLWDVLPTDVQAEFDDFLERFGALEASQGL